MSMVEITIARKTLNNVLAQDLDMSFEWSTETSLWPHLPNMRLRGA